MKKAGGWLCYALASILRIEAVVVLGARIAPEPVTECGPGIATNPKLSPRPSGEYAEQNACSSMSSGDAAGEIAMDTLCPRCAGIDVHKNNVVVAICCHEATAKVREEVRTFATMICHLLALPDWLVEQGVQLVAMKSTNVFLKPVFNILEVRLAVMPVYAQHIRQVPGRRTSWIVPGSRNCCNTVF